MNIIKTEQFPLKALNSEWRPCHLASSSAAVVHRQTNCHNTFFSVLCQHSYKFKIFCLNIIMFQRDTLSLENFKNLHDEEASLSLSEMESGGCRLAVQWRGEAMNIDSYGRPLNWSRLTDPGRSG